MSNFKPQLSYTTRESLDDYYNRRRKHQSITITFNTYRELKKKLKHYCEKNIDLDGVFVVRSKRSHWGEWFERWEIDNGKPSIIKQGWS